MLVLLRRTRSFALLWFAVVLLWTSAVGSWAGVTPVDTTLVLNPSSGAASATFTATLTYYPTYGSGSCPHGTRVSFTWDGQALGAATLHGSACDASITKHPLAGYTDTGGHSVCGSFNDPASGGLHKACKTFTVTAPSPTPSPSPTHKAASPTPTATAKASPRPTTSPRPTSPTAIPSPAALPCDTRTPPRATNGFGYVLLPGIQGGARDAAHLGWISVTDARPSSMIPATLGHAPLVAMTLTKITDKSSQALQKAQIEGTPFPCVFLALGPTQTFRFASYVFENVVISSFRVGQSRTNALPADKLTLAYDHVRWEYQLDGGSTVSGSGAMNATTGGGAGSATLIGIAGVLVAGGAVWGSMTYRRRRNAVSLNPQPLPPGGDPKS